MKTIQNLVTVKFDAELLAAIDAALAQLETHFVGLIYLTAEQKRAAAKMGVKSEGFCRQALTILGQRSEVLPANVNITDALADLEARELLRPRLVRLTALYQRAFDTDIALGSDVMAMALHGYKALKMHGGGVGLEALQREVDGRFRGKGRRQAAAAKVPTA